MSPPESERAASADPRVRHTREQLQGALRALTAEKGYGAVSVRDIAERAAVNRTTFYLHFRDKDALLEQMTEELVAHVAARLDRGADGRLAPDPACLAIVFDAVAAHPAFFRAVLRADSGSGFSARLGDGIAREWLARLPDGAEARDHPPKSLVARAVASTLVGVLAWWVAEGPAHAPQAMAAWTCRLLSVAPIGSLSEPAHPAG